MSSRWAGGAAGAGRPVAARRRGVGRARACRRCRVGLYLAAGSRRRRDAIHDGCGRGHGFDPCCDVACGRDSGSCCDHVADAWSHCGCGSCRVALARNARHQSFADPLTLGAPLAFNTHEDHLPVAPLEKRVREEEDRLCGLVALDLLD